MYSAVIQFVFSVTCCLKHCILCKLESSHSLIPRVTPWDWNFIFVVAVVRQVFLYVPRHAANAWVVGSFVASHQTWTCCVSLAHSSLICSSRMMMCWHFGPTGFFVEPSWDIGEGLFHYLNGGTQLGHSLEEGWISLLLLTKVQVLLGATC